ncbi:MAG: Signal recognition particle receptor FtsY [Ignavibacteria bacterium]|nr:Signal recognition particle receptor FtsY [Ignavibacteria bacterium]
MGFFDKLKEKVVRAVIGSANDAPTQAAEPESIEYSKLKQGLTKTRSKFLSNLQAVFGIGRKIDAALLIEIEDILISADCGVTATDMIISRMKERILKEGFENSEDIFDILKEEIFKLLSNSTILPEMAFEIEANKKPYTILVVGVNGVGKTTTIGKLARNYKNAGLNVVIGAADTFRAAANEQLEIWAERAGVPIISQAQGADPAAVAFDTLQSAISKQLDVVIIDTAGRLHNKTNLMAELEKISRVMKKLRTEAPDEVLLVLDATTGQNAISQAKEFTKVAKLTGIVLTKLDGTAKGGVIIPIAAELNLPVRFIGVGEKIDDLQVFDPAAFVVALFDE